jgi:hypothetical protein
VVADQFMNQADHRRAMQIRPLVVAGLWDKRSQNQENDGTQQQKVGK